MILPWLKIGPGVYKSVWANLIEFDELIVYLMMIQSQISWIILSLFLGSIVFILFSKIDNLLLFFGVYFIAYYLFFTLMEAGEINHRYAMALYPAIAAFLAHFIFSISQRIKWKHFFKVMSLILTVYLIFLCLVPRSSSNLITFKYKDFELQQYPIEQATDWIRNRTKNDDKILFLPIPWSYKVYIERLYAYKDKIDHDRFVHVTWPIAKELIYPTQNLKKFCYEQNISYVVFPFGPNNAYPAIGASKDIIYLARNSDDELREVARFNLEDNYILVYKLEKTVD